MQHDLGIDKFGDFDVVDVGAVEKSERPGYPFNWLFSFFSEMREVQATSNI